MEFSVAHSVEVLRVTPYVLRAMLSGLSDEWLYSNEGKDTWSPFDILGHLIHGEKTDWVPRMNIILSGNNDRKFKPFDRFAQLELNKGKSISDLLNEFEVLRAENIGILESENLTADQLMLTGIHPEFGRVDLKQLLATWIVHDLNHISQISRVMASQYSGYVGPWKTYLSILTK
ncbi:MAG: DinB family protein [Bacteroidetes bacterium]|nr:MAG: DinB family protein [Bacteroidota bacterium]REK05268.1 MAG: DinB family protein [Bacteroidota bacterium]REK32673.1 MAG: DinB family protein [Bacteroidota bacterium]REK48880.1 MAG: DinB family protein [Bacteroidota bacterium]